MEAYTLGSGSIQETLVDILNNRDERSRRKVMRLLNRFREILLEAQVMASTRSSHGRHKKYLLQLAYTDFRKLIKNNYAHDPELRNFTLNMLAVYWKDTVK